MFFVAERVEGISGFCFVIFITLALGELAFAGLFLSTLTVVLDIVTKFIESDIPFSGKAFKMVVDDGFNHSVQDTSDRLSLVIFRIGLDFFPQISDEKLETYLGIYQNILAELKSRAEDDGDDMAITLFTVKDTVSATKGLNQILWTHGLTVDEESR